MAVTQDFRENWLEMQEEYGRKIDLGSIQVMEAGEIDATVSLPAVKFKKKYDPTPGAKNEFKEYRHVPMDTFMQPIDSATERVVAQGNEAERQGNYAEQQGDYARRQGDYAEEEVTYAENVNADLTGLVVTITDRYGVSRSVDIGFEMFATYGSVAEMKADAANVPQGKFVIIATEDPTSEDNAKMYCRTKAPATDTENAFLFLSDLDQASSAAWADWLNNQKPQIEAATAAANAAADDWTDNMKPQVEEAIATAYRPTTCYVDFATMCLMFVQPKADTTQYKVRNGNLNITFPV